MKINPVLTLIQGQKSGAARRAEQIENAKAAASSSSASSLATDVVDIVGAENFRAASAAPLKDLGEAENVLARITGDLGGMTRADLRNIHRLEGLVHFFPA
jgi:hypothetical protein